ncbi:MAG: NAD(P)H-dependent oxidoreductase [Salinivirgaceae bacterium]|jgi:putative NADPH-quinone reductase
MLNILIINGHPNPNSFCHSLAKAYYDGAIEVQNDCQLINLEQLSFNPVLKHGYQQRTELEPDLLHCWESILKADHIVWVYPNWWGTYPALLKGFIDRLFLPGMAFQYRKNSPLVDQLLKGKSARIIVTMDSPGFYYNLWIHQSSHQTMSRSVLKFCGINPVKYSSFHGIKKSSEGKKDKWLSQAFELGKLSK